MKIFLGSLLVLLGIVGILLAATDNLPPELNLPWLNTAITVIGILIVGLGWQDELESGKAGIIDVIKKFFAADPFRQLGLTVVLIVARQIIDSGLFSSSLVLAAQIFLAIAAVFEFGSGYASYRVKLFSLRSK